MHHPGTAVVLRNGKRNLKTRYFGQSSKKNCQINRVGQIPNVITNVSFIKQIRIKFNR